MELIHIYWYRSVLSTQQVMCVSFGVNVGSSEGTPLQDCSQVAVKLRHHHNSQVTSMFTSAGEKLQVTCDYLSLFLIRKRS